jgi:hypothetical protein
MREGVQTDQTLGGQNAARSAVQTQRVTWGKSGHGKEALYDGNLDASKA